MEQGVWRTIGGRRVFIKNGKDLATAMKESGKFKKVDKPEKDDKIVKDQKGKEYKKKLQSLKGKEDGTYDINTGKKYEWSEGYNVSFEQSSDKYTPAEYYEKVEECRTKCDGNIYGGVFGSDPELSFYTKDLKTAKEIMYKYNQHSIWDNSIGDIIKNDRYDEKKNKTNYKG